MSSTLTSSPSTPNRRTRKPEEYKRRIIKYFTQLSSEDQGEITAVLLNISVELPVRSVGSEAESEQLMDLANKVYQQSGIDKWTFSEDKVWQLDALLGETVVNEAIAATGGQLTGQTIIDLLTTHPLPFYLDKNERLLLCGRNPLLEQEVGPLKPIPAALAAQRYGLAKLEDAHERSYTNV